MGSGAEIFNAVINQGGTPAMLSNTLALRPAFGYRGRIFIATDTREIYRDTGISWELIGSGGGSVNIYNSNGTLTGQRDVQLNGNLLRFRGTTTTVQVETRNDLNPTSGGVENILSMNGQGAFVRGIAGANHPGFRTILPGTQFFYGDPGRFTFVGANNTSYFNVNLNGNTVFTILNTGRFLLNTTVDAGFTADINGQTVIRDWLNFSQTNRGIRPTSDSVAYNIIAARNVTNPITISYQGNEGTANSTKNLLSIAGAHQYTHAAGTNIVQVLFNTPQINITGGTTSFYGYRYNPNLISTIGLNHYAIQTDSGIVDHYDRLDLTTSDFSSRNAWTLHARLRQTLTAGADQFGAGYYVGGLHIREISASGANTFGNATINAGGASSLQIDFTGAGTLTASQAGLRAFAGHQIFNTFGGSASGTITHFAGMQILGLYNRNSGSITPTITNAYGLIVNNLNDYSHTFTLTNRWGVYQTGGSDNNYFAGKLLVGTNTVTARQVHIAGDMEFTTTLSGTSGSSSGQHLIVWVNGTQYKIDLRNP